MLQLVDVGRQSIDAYREPCGAEVIDELRRLAADLRGVRVVHINATPYGGGVSELLRSLVPLETDLGLKAEWRIIYGQEPFFRVTKSVHDALQGAEHELSSDEKDTYLTSNIANSRALVPADYDIIVVHDPQPAALLEATRDVDKTKWIWRCHIDTSHANMGVWEYIREFIVRYHDVVFTMQEFVPPDFLKRQVTIIPPAIDPLSPKNMDLRPGMAEQILSWLGMFPGEPFVTQVSRFDKWKDPLGVIEAYKLAKTEIPDLHLALVGSMALDDPTGWDVYNELTGLDLADPNLHIFTNLTGVSNIEVNAFQRFSKAVIQKSIREGFGLVVSEALWKETPVIAGRAGGIPMQLAKGGGFLVDSASECATRIFELFAQPDLAQSIGALGRANVAENFLITRLLRDELALFKSVLNR